MKIAVVNVAAEVGGTVSLLLDFVKQLSILDSENEWYILTSVVKVKETENIHNFRFPQIKKSMMHRLFWEYRVFPQFIKKHKISVVLSMQNNGLPCRVQKQIVYFHNILLIQQRYRFSLFNKSEQRFALSRMIKNPYIRYSWKMADLIITQTESVKEMLSEFYPKEQIMVIPPSLNLDIKEPSDKKVKGFIYPAGPGAYRNFEIIIDAVKGLEIEGKSVEILFTISGEENTYAKEIKRRADRTSGIRLIGRQSRESILQMYESYGLIITSKLESFPFPILEAMHYQTVIVALDFPYVQDQMRMTKYNRLYIAKRDGTDLREMIMKALLDEEKGNFSIKNNSTMSILKLLCK